MKVNINPAIFKAYDIRGVYSQDFQKNTAFAIGMGLVRFLERDKKTKRPLKIVVGRDGRLSSPNLHRNLVKGLIAMGVDVVDLGLVTTPVFYFAVAHYQYDGGIMITASHNPKQYNGFKIVRENATSVNEASGLRDILRLAQEDFQEKRKRGKLVGVSKKVIKDYVNFNLKGFDRKSFESLKIVVDTANTVSGIVVAEIFKELPCRTIHLFKKIDGKFPNHDPDPLIEKNLDSLKTKVLAEKADFGVAFDGDGDRIIFVDEKGGTIDGGAMTAFLSEIILKKYPGSKILYDIRLSRVVEETIRRNGGVPVVYRVGHSFIKSKMKSDKIFFGAELSGHYYQSDNYFCEVPFFVLFTMVGSLKNRPVSQAMAYYKKYYRSGEINLKIEDKKAALSRLRKQYASGKLLEIDGVRVDYSDWWFSARASNTDPVLRLNLEAKTKDLLDKKKAELLALLELK